MKRLLKFIVIWILTIEARLVIARYRPYIIAVTGNIGKTSAKDAIYSALSASLFIRKSEKSLNSDVGVPLTILGCESGWDNPFKWLSNIAEGLALIFLRNHYPRTLVLEVGADRPGDIKKIAKWIHPDIAVITGVPNVPVHVEYFASAEEVVAEKRELAEAVRIGGALVLNGDEERTYAIRSEFRGIAVTYGLKDHNDVVASRVEVLYEEEKPAGMRFRVDVSGASVPVVIRGSVGKTHVYPALAALTVGLQLKKDLVSMAGALSKHDPPPGRMRVLPGVHGSTIIDDTYNASPAALTAALETLESVQVRGRKIAVIADMLELGKFSVEAHREAGKKVAQLADMLVTVGLRSRTIAESAAEAGMPKDCIVQYDDGTSSQAGKDLREMVKEGDIVLVKGSQSMRMERAVKELLADPSRAPELLVRQDRAWSKR